MRLRRIPGCFVFSCRDFYWGLFEADFWKAFTKEANSTEHESQTGNATDTKRQLANFSNTEDHLAFDKYFTHYQIHVTPEGNAREQFRHPLLLRFFCETYRGEHVGTIRDVRLKHLFDRYWKQKLGSMADRMRDQDTRARVQDLVAKFGDCIVGIAREMLTQCRRSLPVPIAREKAQSAHQTLVVDLPYSRIVDEYIILEEVEAGNGGTQVVFVFEEFMEYAMAARCCRNGQTTRST